VGKIKEFASVPEIRELCLGADGVVGFLCQLPSTGVALMPTSTLSRWRCACARYSFGVLGLRAFSKVLDVCYNK
jgi:hypothetical protein